MFTGIVEELGRVNGIALSPQSALLTVQAEKVLQGSQIGDSIAVNGVCLTVVGQAAHHFTVDVMSETLSRTNLAELQRGSPVNLERALQLQTRLGGHLVSGHIDGTGRITRIIPAGIARVVHISAEPSLLHYMLAKGSIAIDGISLTLVDVGESGFSVSLIPHTFRETTLGTKGIGSTVNLETDLIGKYVANFLRETPGKKSSELSLEFLSQHGFL